MQYHLIHGYPPTQHPKLHLDRFSRFAQLTAESPNALQWAATFDFSLKINPSHEGDLNMVPWAHPSPHPKRHLNPFSHFCRAHDRDRQTDRQTTLSRLRITAMRHNNKWRW